MPLEQAEIDQIRAEATETSRYVARTMALSGRPVSEERRLVSLERYIQERIREAESAETAASRVDDLHD